jgi:hypothetical protein
MEGRDVIDVSGSSPLLHGDHDPHPLGCNLGSDLGFLSEKVGRI